MSDQHLQNSTGLFADPGGEAGASGPEFSQELHDRIMHRIASAAMGNPSRSRRYHRLLPVALAAVVVLLGGVFVGMSRLGRDAQMSRQVVASSPTVRYPSFALHVPAICQMTVNPYADVDHQSELVLGYLTRQLDVLPAYRPNPGAGQHG